MRLIFMLSLKVKFQFYNCRISSKGIFVHSERKSTNVHFLIRLQTLSYHWHISWWIFI